MRWKIKNWPTNGMSRDQVENLIGAMAKLTFRLIIPGFFVTGAISGFLFRMIFWE